MLHAVIMAGGSGTRFWPESRAARPKQLLRLVDQRTMIQATVDRLRGLIPNERVLIVTGARLVDQVAAQLPQLPREAILGEPCRRDTAPCIGLAALRISRQDADATMLVMPADHAIQTEETFGQAIRLAVELVGQSPERIVTFGIRPTYAAESFGYLERGAPLVHSPAAAAGAGPAIFQVRQFREKPRAEIARQYLAAGNFYWNSGIFVWQARTILQALRQYQPEMAAHLEKIAAAEGSSQFAAVFEREFTAIRGVSIDYAVVEHARDVVVIEAPFTWDDVGSWQSIARLRGVDAEGNTIHGRHLGLKTTGTIVRSSDDHLIVTLGLSNCIVVHTPDATLVANKQDEESIRQLVKMLEERGWQEYL
jgi:mannose-1-phosphate guanylyltransferase